MAARRAATVREAINRPVRADRWIEGVDPGLPGRSVADPVAPWLFAYFAGSRGASPEPLCGPA